jgi:hypothetical protein
VDLADPANPTRLTATSTGYEEAGSFAPDDGTVVYERLVRPNGGALSKKDSGIFALNADGTGSPTQLVKGRAFYPDWALSVTP